MLVQTQSYGLQIGGSTSLGILLLLLKRSQCFYMISEAYKSSTLSLLTIFSNPFSRF